MAECGTPAGYKRHYRNKEEICMDCRIAYNANRTEYRNNNPKIIKASRDKHYRAYPERAMARAKKREEMLKAAITDNHTLQDIIDTYGTDCHLCNEPIDMTAPRKNGQENWQVGFQVDHIIPISRGGVHVHTNIQVIPASLNCRKSNKLPHELSIAS
jgi:5-methylcytosine-specific restriction endonuclease McrA